MGCYVCFPLCFKYYPRSHEQWICQWEKTSHICHQFSLAKALFAWSETKFIDWFWKCSGTEKRFWIERRQVVFLCRMQDSNLGSLRHQIASRLNAHSQTNITWKYIFRLQCICFSRHSCIYTHRTYWLSICCMDLYWLMMEFVTF